MTHAACAGPWQVIRVSADSDFEQLLAAMPRELGYRVNERFKRSHDLFAGSARFLFQQERTS